MDAKQGLDPPRDDLKVLGLLGGDLGGQFQDRFPARPTRRQAPLQIAVVIFPQDRPFGIASVLLGILDRLVERTR